VVTVSEDTEVLILALAIIIRVGLRLKEGKQDLRNAGVELVESNGLVDDLPHPFNML
jgi:hypothetical protein